MSKAGIFWTSYILAMSIVSIYTISHTRKYFEMKNCIESFEYHAELFRHLNAEEMCNNTLNGE